MVEISYRSVDGWPLSVSWAIADSNGPDGHLSLLSAAVSGTANAELRPPAANASRTAVPSNATRSHRSQL